jgi:hypothetical protein
MTVSLAEFYFDNLERAAQAVQVLSFPFCGFNGVERIRIAEIKSSKREFALGKPKVAVDNVVHDLFS